MRTKAVLVVILLAVAAAGSVMYWRGLEKAREGAAAPVEKAPTPASPEESEDDFLKEARALAEKATEAKETGALPPEQTDGSAVAVIEVDPPEVFDVGTIPREGIYTTEFKVYNRGKTNLEITRVQSACGCVKASLVDNKKVVPPGDHALISVKINPRAIHGFESRKSVTIYSTDPERSKVRIDVLAKIDPEFALEPPELDFGEVRKGTPIESAILFRQLQDEPIEIQELQQLFGGGDLEIAFEKRPESEWAKAGHVEYNIKVRLSEYLSPGTFNGRFSIRTNCKRISGFNYVVKAKIDSFYTMAPSRMLTVRTRPLPGRQETPARVSITADRPFEILDLTPSSDHLLVSLEPGTAPNSAFLKVSVNEGANPGHRNESIEFTIKTSEETLRERIPVRIIAMRAPSSVPARAPRIPSSVSR